MEFSMEITKTVTETVTMDSKNLIVSKGSMIDTDSVSITVFTKDFETEVASGTLNIKTNWAHLTLDVEDEDGELEDYLVDAIEGRTINFA
jgi:hypothetical protein